MIEHSIYLSEYPFEKPGKKAPIPTSEWKFGEFLVFSCPSGLFSATSKDCHRQKKPFAKGLPREASLVLPFSFFYILLWQFTRKITLNCSVLSDKNQTGNWTLFLKGKQKHWIGSPCSWKLSLLWLSNSMCCKTCCRNLIVRSLLMQELIICRFGFEYWWISNFNKLQKKNDTVFS